MNPRLSSISILIFFFLSGITGLLYEIVWTRLLTLSIGNTHYSITTVLTAFMGGLTLGSFLGGKIADKSPHPLRFYAILELGIGLYCFLVPAFIDWAQPIFQWAYASEQNSFFNAVLFRFAVCGGILLIPTTLMGATLPALGKFLAVDKEYVGRDVGTLYGINTFGAVIGALSSAFFFMPQFGLQGTIWIAATVNVGIAIIIFSLFKDSPAKPKSESADLKEFSPEISLFSLKGKGLVLWIFGFSGISAMIYQVAWNRIFSLVLGSSVYAFSLIVTTFILGLALGAVTFSRLSPWFKDWIKVFGMLQTGIGIAALTALPFFGLIPLFNRWGFDNLGLDFGTVQVTNFVIIFMFLFVPTFLMGGQFPVVIKLISKDLNSLGKQVGAAYGSNTLGTIVGSFVGGFFLVPYTGIQNSILVAVFLNIGFGLLLLARAQGVSLNVKAYVLPAVLIFSLVSAYQVPAWDKAILSSGSFMPYRINDLDEAVKKNNKILFYKEGIHTTVTTELAASGNIFLRVNGKTDASLALDMRTQLLSGYLPMFFHPDPKSVLVVGYGSGITLGAVEQFPVKEIDLVEISQAVMEGANYFGPFNHQAVKDKRVHTIFEDGRNHIALTDKKYDVIISEPSNPWISGVGALFTLEFFQQVKRRLNPGGIICIWIHTNMSPESFKSIAKTYNAVFPVATMWESIVGDDYLLIGSSKQYHLAFDQVENHLKKSEIKNDLKQIGIFSVKDVMSLMLMSKRGIEKFAADSLIHTDDNLLLEFQAPAYIYKDERAVLVRQLAPFFKIDTKLIRFDNPESAVRKKFINEVKTLQRSASQVQEIKRKARIQRLLEEGEKAFGEKRYPIAANKYSEILILDPNHVMGIFHLGSVFFALGELEKAEKAYKRSIEINPYYVFGSIALSKLYLSMGKPEQAVKTLESIHKWFFDAETYSNLGVAYSIQKERRKARQALESAVQLDPDYPPAYYYLGIHHANDRPGMAKDYLKKFLDLDGDAGEPNMIRNAKNLIKKL